MHELSIALHLIEAAESAARAAGAREVVRVRLRLGELAGVDAQALRFSFDVAVQGTLLAGAVLDIEDVSAYVRCEGCGVEFTHTMPFVGVCARCGSPHAQLVRGREMEITEMEIEDAAAAPVAESSEGMQ